MVAFTQTILLVPKPAVAFVAVKVLVFIVRGPCGVVVTGGDSLASKP